MTDQTDDRSADAKRDALPYVRGGEGVPMLRGFTEAQRTVIAKVLDAQLSEMLPDVLFNVADELAKQAAEEAVAAGDDVEPPQPWTARELLHEAAITFQHETTLGPDIGERSKIIRRFWRLLDAVKALEHEESAA